MNIPTNNLMSLFAGIWPRIAGFSNTPSLLAIALIANLVAMIPGAFRTQKDGPVCEPGVAACSESAPAKALSD